MKENEKLQRAILIHTIAKEALEINNKFRFTTGEDPYKIAH